MKHVIKNCKLFVYGSLKKGSYNNSFLVGSKFLGEFYTSEGFTLYDVGHFPGMVRGAGKVLGHLFEIERDCLWIIDNLEGHPIMYKREKIVLDDGQSVYAYIWQWKTTRMPHLGEVWNDVPNYKKRRR